MARANPSGFHRASNARLDRYHGRIRSHRGEIQQGAVSGEPEVRFLAEGIAVLLCRRPVRTYPGKLRQDCGCQVSSGKSFTRGFLCGYQVSVSPEFLFSLCLYLSHFFVPCAIYFPQRDCPGSDVFAGSDAKSSSLAQDVEGAFRLGEVAEATAPRILS